MFPLGWLNQLLGLAMNGIDWCMYHLLGVHNVGWCIVIFTLFVYILMYPLNAKQQKSSRLMNKINPEIKAIQKKYKNKKDQASQMKMNQETQDIYAKYGISPFGGCLPLLITMPILFALYNVIRNIPYYVNGIGSMKENPEAYKFLGLLVNESPMSLFKDRANYPYAGILVFLIPILAMVLQFINTKLLQVKTDAGEQDQMQSSMKMMNYMMPVMSGFFCLSFDVSIGIYWIIGSLFRIVQAILINRKVDSISLDELIEKNKGKATKKSAKREAMNRQMEEYAKKKTAGIKSASAYQNTAASSSKEEEVQTHVNKDFESGSIAGYAHMLSGNKHKKKEEFKMEQWKEFSAKTADEALTNALIQMETTSDQIEYEVVEEEKSGILGLFSKPAVIRVRKKENVVDTVKNFLAKTFQAMKLDVEIETEFDEVENEIRIELKGTEMGMLIGKRGQTLDSLQYLTSLVANKNKDTYTKIKIDTENYRQRRKETIENLARNVASKVKKTGRPAFLEPMNPYERRIIHAELQADKYVDTHSEGEEPHRKVVITLNREFASELPRRNNYRRRNNNYSRDRKRPYQEKKD